jgi:Dyp-type peroxidase family
MAVDLTKNPIDRKSKAPAVASLLKNLQGNILKGHGRDHTIHLFLRFLPTPGALSKAKQWIKKFAKERVTSAKKQFEEMDDFRKFKIIGGLFANFFLAHKGYEILGVPSPRDRKFVAGMKTSRADLADPDLAAWEEGYRGKIHASILLAHDDESELNREARVILQEVREFADVVAGERGKAMRNENCETAEHFGYVDGRSQPLFLTEDIEDECRKEPGTVAYDPSAPPNLVLVRDPNGAGDVSFGSYLVFRKLEQNVRDFKKAEEELARKLGLKGDDKERAGALIVGRFEDGTPVVLHKKEGFSDPIPNNFDYSKDRDGGRCPFHAHIRKINPRGETVDPRATEEERRRQMEKERSHRIARRGITYGERCREPKDEPEGEDLPTKDVGLLFMCFQSDIANQFEFMQGQWANDKDPLRQKTGIDPVIGQADGQAKDQSWPTTWGGSDRKTFSFADFVTLKGGEYFFAPSISALTNIARAPRRKRT